MTNKTRKTLKTAPLPTEAQEDKFRLIAARAYIQELKDDLTVFFHICESDLQEQTGLPTVKLDKESTGVSLAGQEVEIYDNFFTLNGLWINYLDVVAFLSGEQAFVSTFIPSDKEPASVLHEDVLAGSAKVLQFPTRKTLQ